MSRDYVQFPAAELVRIDPDKGTHRFYHAGLWPDLFGGVSVMREWGRIGQAGQLRLEPYDDRQQAEAALDRLVQQKQRRGYRRLN